MSAEPRKLPDYISIPIKTEEDEHAPIITITPATLTVNHVPRLDTTTSSTAHGLPTPPITPTTPKPILKTRKSTTPISAYQPSSLSLSSLPLHHGGKDHFHPHPSLHVRLRRHLALLHPSTPTGIVEFCAVRLLSRDRPYGHDGDWVPIYEPDERGNTVDLSSAGLQLDAPKGYARAQLGEGKETDKRLENMYRIARRGYTLLEEKCPGVDKL